MATPPVLQPIPAGHYGAWHVFWLCWLIASVGTFLVAEIYALCTDWQRTLSAAVWNLEKFAPGQGITKWTALHFGLIAILAVLFLWLLGHFGWGLWRS